jgi:hypothetical protein
MARLDEQYKAIQVGEDANFHHISPACITKIAQPEQY